MPSQDWSAGWRAAGMAVLLALATPAAAQFSEGTYVIPDSGYSITIRKEGDRLVVVEPNKISPYTQTAPGEYQFRNPTNDILYGIRIIDAQTIEAFKPGSGAPGTRLSRQGGAPAPAAAEPAPAPTMPATVASAPDAGPHMAVAEKYKALVLADPKDAQTWAFCGAAALRRVTASKAQADAYGREVAAALQSIQVDPGARPCSDAIPPELWPGGKADPAEAEAAARLNAEYRDAAAKQASEIAAMQAKAAADQAAYVKAMAQHEAALAKARAEQDAFARQQDAYRKAAAEHEKQMEEYRRKGGK